MKTYKIYPFFLFRNASMWNEITSNSQEGNNDGGGLQQGLTQSGRQCVGSQRERCCFYCHLRWGKWSLTQENNLIIVAEHHGQINICNKINSNLEAQCMRMCVYVHIHPCMHVCTCTHLGGLNPGSSQ